MPAQIEHIVQFVSNNDVSNMNTLVAIRKFKQLNNQSDPFSIYPLLRTQNMESQTWCSRITSNQCQSVPFCLFYHAVGRWTSHGHGLIISCASWFSFISIITKIFHRNFNCILLIHDHDFNNNLCLTALFNTYKCYWVCSSCCLLDI